ncbi:hypothetical protein E2C01_037804 [Portunus trituberculatus]|uniref:Uncharacterized protein n=1 Tax=Portunus trituberculatus TaxID=210409 RepID=A0A5B7F931_PORTR|nr:hypothetical protein [Portunus trituberculatus]
MVTPNPASESLSGDGATNVPRSDSSLKNYPKYLDTFLNFFYISFCNIHILRSNFQSVKHHRSSTKPHLFLTETLLSEATDRSPNAEVPASASWGDQRRYYADLSWNDYCFRVRGPSLCAERITEVIVSDMEAYIPHSFSQPKPSKPWFNSACSCAIHDRDSIFSCYT